MEGDRPLFAIAKSWKGLQGELGSEVQVLRVDSFSHACSLISPLFGCLGVAFKFAEKDYVSKVSYISWLDCDCNLMLRWCTFLEEAGFSSVVKFIVLLRVQVRDLSAAAKDYATLPAMVDGDIRNNTVRNGGSHTRNLLRVLRGVDMVKVLFEHILVTE